MLTFSQRLALSFVVLLAITALAFPAEIARRTPSTTDTGNNISNCSSINQGPPTECGQIGNTVIICSPSANDSWANDGTPHAIVWNSRHPLLAAASSVDIYLTFQQNFKDNLVKDWLGQPSDPRSLASYLTVCVDSSWFPPNLTKSLSDAPNLTFNNFAIRIVPAGNPSGLNDISVSPDMYAVSDNFTVVDISPSLLSPPSNSTTSTTSLATYITTTLLNILSTSFSPPQSNSSNLAEWQIALIAVSGAAVVIAIAATGFAYTLRRHLNHRKSVAGSVSSCTMITSSQFARPNFPQNPPSSLSIASTSPLVNSFEKHQGAKVGPQDPEDSNFPAGILSKSIPPAAPGVLSTTDARLIAEIFRRKMRKPEWGEGEDIMDEDERRETGERLLREELAEEGTDLKSVSQKRATVDDESVSRIVSQTSSE